MFLQRNTSALIGSAFLALAAIGAAIWFYLPSTYAAQIAQTERAADLVVEEEQFAAAQTKMLRLPYQMSTIDTLATAAGVAAVSLFAGLLLFVFSPRERWSDAARELERECARLAVMRTASDEIARAGRSLPDT